MNPDNKTSSVSKITKPSTKSSKVLKINREYGDQNNGGQNSGDQKTTKNSKTTNVTPKKAEDLDNLLDYMLERHKSEQHKLKSME